MVVATSLLTSGAICVYIAARFSASAALSLSLGSGSEANIFAKCSCDHGDFSPWACMAAISGARSHYALAHRGIQFARNRIKCLLWTGGNRANQRLFRAQHGVIRQVLHKIQDSRSSPPGHSTSWRRRAFRPAAPALIQCRTPFGPESLRHLLVDRRNHVGSRGQHAQPVLLV